MKNKKTPILVFLVVFLIYIAILYLTSSKAGGYYPPYTTFNAQEDGVSLVYDVLEELGLPVETSYIQITENSYVNDIQIIIEPSNFFFGKAETKHILEWVSEGGRLIFLSDSDTISEDIEYYEDVLPLDKNEYYSLYSYGFGEIVVGDAYLLTNEALMENSIPGEYLRLYIEGKDYESIVFNEYYHGFQDKPSLWSTFPSGFKMVSYQIIAICILIIWYIGKRFGKPVPYYEEIEREENEHIKALSVIYRNAAMGDVVLEYYYNNFIKHSAKYFGLGETETKESIIYIWQRENMPELSILEIVEQRISKGESLNIKKSSNRKNFLLMIKYINQLTKYVKFK